jgi:hypothetical protein
VFSLLLRESKTISDAHSLMDLNKPQFFSDLRNYCFLLFYRKGDLDSTKRKVPFFCRIDDSFQSSSYFVATTLHAIRSRVYSSSALCDIDAEILETALCDHVPQLLREFSWHCNIRRKLPKDENSLDSVLEASALIQLGQVERNSVGCHLTPLLFPFLQEVISGSTVS